MKKAAVLALVIICVAQLVLCAPKLTVSPTVLSTSQTVQISWGGVTDPSDKDMIAIYTPADSKEDNYIGWLPLSKSSSWESGFGNLVNSNQIIYKIINHDINYGNRILR